MSAVAVVVIPARDEEERIGACLSALAVQAGVAPGDLQVVVVLDGCQDGTAQAVEAARRAHPWLAITVLETEGIGAGLARREGMLVARQRAPQMLCSTDADTVVARDWVAAQLAAVRGGAGAVAGRVELDAVEAAELHPDVLAARAADGRRRLAHVRTRTPDAEHGQFSAASLALTCAAHDMVGGIPALPAGEDDALERALVASGVRVAYPRGVRVTTSARAGGRMTEPPAAPATPREQAGGVLVVEARTGRRGIAVREALAAASPDVDVVVVLPEAVADPDAVAERLAAPLQADPDLALVKAVPPAPHPLDDVLARPLLELHAPPLTAVRSPLGQAWAVRRELLAELPLPAGDAVDVAVLVDVHRRCGLGAVAQVPADVPAVPAVESSTLSYEILSAVGERSRSAQEGPPVQADERFRPATRPGSSPSAW